MKKLLMVLALVFLASPAWAVNVNLQWDASTGPVADYVVLVSTDGAQTWDSGRGTGSVVPNDQNEINYTYTDAPDTGLVLFMVRARTASGLISGHADPVCFFVWGLSVLIGASEA